MNDLVQWLRAWVRQLGPSVADGACAFRDLLLWGRVYPRAIDLRSLQRMRHP